MTLPADAVLLVEDDESLRQVLARHLRRRGFVTVEAESAEEAVKELEAGLRPGLIMLDINLPGESGWELLRRPLLAVVGSAIVIMSTTIVSPHRLVEFKLAGFLPKPFALEAFTAIVERFVGTAS